MDIDELVDETNLNPLWWVLMVVVGGTTLIVALAIGERHKWPLWEKVIIAPVAATLAFAMVGYLVLGVIFLVDRLRTDKNLPQAAPGDQNPATLHFEPPTPQHTPQSRRPAAPFGYQSGSSVQPATGIAGAVGVLLGIFPRWLIVTTGVICVAFLAWDLGNRAIQIGYDTMMKAAQVSGTIDSNPNPPQPAP